VLGATSGLRDARGLGQYQPQRARWPARDGLAQNKRGQEEKRDSDDLAVLKDHPDLDRAGERPLDALCQKLTHGPLGVVSDQSPWEKNTQPSIRGKGQP